MQQPSTRIRELASKWLNGTISEPELQEFNTWYNQFNDEELELPDGSDTPEEIRERMLQHIIGKTEKQATALPRRRWYGWAAAACLAGLLWFTGQRLNWWQGRRELSVQTSAAMQKIILPDSSLVWLKANSRLQYPSSFGRKERLVKLEGEALFEIAPGAQRPFIVQAGNYTAKVLGTSFNIKTARQAQAMELTVLTGKVAVTEKDNARGTVLAAKQKLVARAAKFDVKPVVPQEQASLAQGTEYNMDFHGTPFDQVVQRLEKKFNVRCHIESAGLQYCRLSVNLTDQSLQQSLMLIAATANGRYEIQEGLITWSGEGCK